MERLNGDIENQIRALKLHIDAEFRRFGEERFTEELRDLRHKVFTAHSFIEGSLEGLIKAYPVSKRHPLNINGILDFWDRGTARILPDLCFAKKVSLYENLRDPNGEKKTFFKDLKDLNSIRNEFAHPKNKEYVKYLNRDEYRRALEIISRALEFNEKEVFGL